MNLNSWIALNSQSRKQIIMKFQPRTLFALSVFTAVLVIGSLTPYSYNVFIEGSEIFSRTNVGVLLTILVAVCTFVAFYSEYNRKQKEYTDL